MPKYAAETTVDAYKSRAEIERTLMRYGASSFGYATEESRAAVTFIAHGRQIRFIVVMPDKNDREFTETPTGLLRSDATAKGEWEKACRQRWRALALVIKAKLEAVEAKIVEFDDEFLAHTVIPGTGRTVAETVGPQLTRAIESGEPARLSIESGK